MTAPKKISRYVSGINKQVATWSDVSEIFLGRPYAAINKFANDVPDSTIARAKQRGYFGDGLSLRLWRITNQELRLTDYGSIKPNIGR